MDPPTVVVQLETRVASRFDKKYQQLELGLSPYSIIRRVVFRFSSLLCALLCLKYSVKHTELCTFCVEHGGHRNLAMQFVACYKYTYLMLRPLHRVFPSGILFDSWGIIRFRFN
jgi:hypothetical protein